MSKTVWAVESGSYSDYTVHFICPTEAIAKACADHMNADPNHSHYDDYEVREMQLLTKPPSKVVIHRRWLNYETGETKEWSFTSWDFECGYSPVVVERIMDGHIVVIGTNLARVEKAFHDEVAQYKAMKEGIA